jgi:chemotaxis protein MotB
MARRKHVEEPINHERWLVSYADFITLLFAFFVVMYSISSVNEDKYRVLSDAMGSAFYDPKASVSPAQVSQVVTATVIMPSYISAASKPPDIMAPLLRAGQQGAEQAVEAPEEESFSQQVLDDAEDEIDGIAEGVELRMDSLIDDGIINITRNKFWLEVEIKSSLLFTSGSSNLIPDSVPVLIELSETFLDLPNRINIEGFTDNQPISNQIFPSNWELSSARAAAVVRLFERNGIEPSRLASIGYGEYQPISDNENEDARAKNRRVVLVVMASLEGQQDKRIYEFELLKEKSVSR